MATVTDLVVVVSEVDSVVSEVDTDIEASEVDSVTVEASVQALDTADLEADFHEVDMEVSGAMVVVSKVNDNSGLLNYDRIQY